MDKLTRIVIKQRHPRREWTHVLAADGKAFTSPAIARWYMQQNGIKGALKFVR